MISSFQLLEAAVGMKHETHFPGLLPRTPTKLANPRPLLLSNPSPLCDPEDAPAKQTPSGPRGSHPAQSLEMDQLPPEKTPPLDQLPDGLEQR